MYLLFKNKMKEGVCYISKRYSETRKTYLTSYNPNKPIKCITCLDKNDLCDFAT